MAGGFPSVGLSWGQSQSSASTATSLGTTVTCSGSTNTVGSYAQLIASTTITASWMLVAMDNSGTAVSTLVDISVGGAGSEKVLLNALTNSANLRLYQTALFPVNIPAASRIAARAQSPTASATNSVSVLLFDDAFGSVGGSATADTYGAVTGTSLGTSVDPGATANTKGAYVQLTASTTADYAGFVLGFNDLGQASQNANCQWLFDVAVGAAGSEKVILPNAPCVRQSFTTVFCNPPFFPYAPIPIAAGTRIAVRCQATVNTATTRLCGVILYGIRQ